MKSKIIQIFLTLIFGPIGLLYSSIGWGVGLLIFSLMLAFISPFLCIFPWFLSQFIGIGAVADYNANIYLSDVS